MTSDINILDFARSEAKKNKININNVLEMIEDDNNYEAYDPIIKILPKAKLLVDNFKYNICYHGRDCIAESKRVYEYKTMGKIFYITCIFDNGGDDMEVLTYTDGPGGFNTLKEWYKLMVKIYTKDKFDIHKFIKTNKVDVLIQIYRNFYSKSIGFEKMVEYMRTKYYKKIKNTAYVALSCGYEKDLTFAIGIYKTEKIAKEAIIDLLLKKKKNLILMKDNGINNNNDFRKFFLDGEDDFQDCGFDLCIVECVIGSDGFFDFSQWNWDSKNLYLLLEALKDCKFVLF